MTTPAAFPAPVRHPYDTAMHGRLNLKRAFGAPALNLSLNSTVRVRLESQHWPRPKCKTASHDRLLFWMALSLDWTKF